MPRRPLVAAAVAASALFATGCGEEAIQLTRSDPHYEGAKLFEQHCSGCHTLSAAGTQGSATNPNDREYKDGPNFDQRRETVDGVLFAIQNGGYSSGPMPQDIVVGEEARKIAEFVAEFSGREAETQQSP